MVNRTMGAREEISENVPQWKLDMWQSQALWKSCDSPQDFAKFLMILEILAPWRIHFFALTSIQSVPTGSVSLANNENVGVANEPETASFAEPLNHQLEMAMKTHPEVRGGPQDNAEKLIAEHEKGIKELQQLAEEAKSQTDGSDLKPLWRQRLEEKRAYLKEQSAMLISKAFDKAADTIQKLPEPAQQIVGIVWIELSNALMGLLSEIFNKISEVLKSFLGIVMKALGVVVDAFKVIGEKFSIAWTLLRGVFC